MPRRTITKMRPLMGLSVVMVGNLSEGFKAYGPFATFDEASEWANFQDFGLLEAWVMKLEEPIRMA